MLVCTWETVSFGQCALLLQEADGQPQGDGGVSTPETLQAISCLTHMVSAHSVSVGVLEDPLAAPVVWLQQLHLVSIPMQSCIG